mgnify:FL=1
MEEIETKRSILDEEMEKMEGIEIQTRENYAESVITKESELRHVLNGIGKSFFEKAKLFVLMLTAGMLQKDEFFENILTEREFMQNNLTRLTRAVRDWGFPRTDAGDSKIKDNRPTAQ